MFTEPVTDKLPLIPMLPFSCLITESLICSSLSATGIYPAVKPVSFPGAPVFCGPYINIPPSIFEPVWKLLIQ